MVAISVESLRTWTAARAAAAGQVAALALRNVLRHKLRSLTAVSAVAFGVIAMVLANGFIDWSLWAMREGTIRSQLGHIQVSRSGYRSGGTADPFAYLIPTDAAVRGALESDPNNAVVAPRLSFSGLVSHGDATVSFIGEGVVPEREFAIQHSLGGKPSVNIVDGQDLATGDQPQVILGKGLAENLGARVGDKVVLLANRASGGLGAVEATVTGVFQTVTKAYDDAALRVTLPTAKTLLRASGDHVLVVLLRDTWRTTPVIDAWRRRFAGGGVEFTPWYELADFYNKTAVLFSRQAAVVDFIIAIIVVLSISNTLMMSVLGRVGEIGTAMALGVTRAQILRQFVVEGAWLGLLGGVAGAVVGVALALIISAVGIPMPPPPGMDRGFVAEILVTASRVVEALGLALGTALAASLYPAWRASRFVVVDALRFNR